MTIYEFCRITNTELRVYHNPEAVSLWISNICGKFNGYSCDFKTESNSPILSSGCGWGSTPEEAVRDMLHNWKLNKYALMVVNACTNDRKEYNIPKYISGIL